MRVKTFGKIMILIVLCPLLCPLFLAGQVSSGGTAENSFIQQAMKQLDVASSPPKGELYLFALEHQLKGSFTYDISIRKKGEVATVFVISSENGSIKDQNLLKDRVKLFRFDMKIPKGQSYKFRYTFKFT